MYRAYVKITQMRIERYCYGKLKNKKERDNSLLHVSVDLWEISSFCEKYSDSDAAER